MRRALAHTPRSATHAAAIAALVVALGALPAGASSGPTSLVDPGASPTTGTSSTAVTFRVTYRNREGSPAEHVRVVIANVPHDMRAGAGSYKSGIAYAWTTALPGGRWTTRFEALNRGRFEAVVAGPTVTISDPPPTPRPTAPPTPRPTAPPTPRPTPSPTARPTPTPSPRATPTPSPRPTSSPTPRPTSTTPASTPTAPPPTARATPTLVPATTPLPTSTLLPTATPAPDPRLATPPGSVPAPVQSPGPTGLPWWTDAPRPSPTPTRPADAAAPEASPAASDPGGVVGAPGAPDPRGPGSGGGGVAAPTPPTRGAAGGARDRDSVPGTGDPLALVHAIVRVLPALAVTSGAVSLAMAFLVFGKRRRDELETASDVVLAGAAATGLAMIPGAAVATLPMPSRGFAAPMAPDIDAHLPRWRRPSLMAARKADPLREITSPTRLTFGRDDDESVSGLERRLIRYRLVSLLDLPDEVHGAQIGVLDEGDEVVVLEKRGTYVRVRCPDASEGWLHKMTLGDVVIDAGGGHRGSWASDEAPFGFEDVLRSRLERRAQFGEA